MSLLHFRINLSIQSLVWFLIVVINFSILNVIVCGLMLYGIRTLKPSLFFPKLLDVIIECILDVYIIIREAIIIFEHENWNSKTQFQTKILTANVVLLCYAVFCLLMNLRLFVVVWRCYKYVKAKNQWSNTRNDIVSFSYNMSNITSHSDNLSSVSITVTVNWRHIFEGIKYIIHSCSNYEYLSKHIVLVVISANHIWQCMKFIISSNWQATQAVCTCFTRRCKSFYMKKCLCCCCLIVCLFTLNKAKVVKLK